MHIIFIFYRSTYPSIYQVVVHISIYSLIYAYIYMYRCVYVCTLYAYKSINMSSTPPMPRIISPQRVFAGAVQKKRVYSQVINTDTCIRTYIYVYVYVYT